MTTRMNIRKLEDGLWLMDDVHHSTCYLVEGTEKAMLIDSVNGEEDLRAIVETLTDKPIIVVNTHGHCDHILGNVFFDEAWLHPAYAELYDRHMRLAQEEWGLTRLSCPVRFLRDRQVFDLGGETLEVIHVPGHTAGSVALLDRKRRLLFTGDAMNPHLWMQVEQSLPISVLRDTLIKVRNKFSAEFDRVLYGHAQDYRDASLINEIIEGCEELLRGETQKDLPYSYFNNTRHCLQHPYGTKPDQVIVYNTVR